MVLLEGSLDIAKLVRNTYGSAITALARIDTAELSSNPGLRALATNIAEEVLACAAATGCDLRASVDVASMVQQGKAGVRPSMLQDVLQGRPIEVEAQLGQIQEFAREMAVPVPTIEVLLPLLRGLDRSLRAAPAAASSIRRTGPEPA